jgi:hypothetical protein
MKNLFKQEDHTGLWLAAAITGALAAGAGIWFYLRGKRAAEQDVYRLGHVQDYLTKKSEKKIIHKSDINDLAAIQYAQA